MRKWQLIIIVLLIFMTGIASAAIGLSYSQTESVAYGEVTYEQSDLEIDNYELVGPGINADEVHIDVTNPTSSDIDANVSVYLIGGSTEITNGSAIATVAAGTTATVVVDIDRTRANQIDSVDIQLTDQ